MAVSSLGMLREKRDDTILPVEWQIDGFSLLSGTAGSFYDSPTFRFSNSFWNLRMYPFSEASENSSSAWIGLYLYRSDVSTEVVAYDFSVKKADGSLCSTMSFMWKFVDNGGYGSPRLWERSELLRQSNDLLPSDALTIVCVLKKPLLPQEMNRMCSGLKDILASRKFSDVTIYVGQQVFQAHKIILAASSPVFAAMFEHEMSENNSDIVSIPDCDPESFNDFLHFLYTGCADITERKVSHLYKTAHKYQVEELVSQCVAFMVQNLSVDNICEAFAFGLQYSDGYLKSYCYKFFEDNIQSILLSSRWESFMKENYLVANKILKMIAPNIGRRK